MVFSYGPLFDKPDKYYSIKINHINEDDNDERMMTISDTSQQVLANEQKNINELLRMINATVNHELRNPLNSFVAYN